MLEKAAIKKIEKDIYYQDIASNKAATITKLIDRCHNISSMAGVFTLEKIDAYIIETENYIYPLLRQAKDLYPEFSNVLFILKYQIYSVIGAIEGTLKSCNP